MRSPAPVIAQIASEDEDAGFHRGPVKGLPRMNEKLAEYVEEGKPFPRAACVIDVLRNSVAFDTAGQILAAFDALESHESLQLTGIREVGRSVHIHERKIKDLKKIDIGRCLGTVRPALWPGDVEYDLSYMLRWFNQLQKVAENEHFVCELSL